MDGILYTIAINYCPLTTKEEKLKNQQKFCVNCQLHQVCEAKAKKCFETLKEDYLRPYTSLVEFAKNFNKEFFDKSKTFLNRLKENSVED